MSDLVNRDAVLAILSDMIGLVRPDVLVDAIGAVRELSAASPWHRVEEELPPKGKRVAVYDGDSLRFMKRVENIECRISVPYWENDDESWERLFSWHYWMPIELPKEGA